MSVSRLFSLVKQADEKGEGGSSLDKNEELNTISEKKSGSQKRTVLFMFKSAGCSPWNLLQELGNHSMENILNFFFKYKSFNYKCNFLKVFNNWVWIRNATPKTRNVGVSGEYFFPVRHQLTASYVPCI
jgi:hypothetical protein